MQSSSVVWKKDLFSSQSSSPSNLATLQHEESLEKQQQQKKRQKKKSSKSERDKLKMTRTRGREDRRVS